MNYTNNYHLPQWAETDRIMMEDFNQAMADIEEGMSDNAQAAETAQAAAATAQASADAVADSYMPGNKPYVVGSYTGTGEAATITLGFRPSFLIISGMGDTLQSNSTVEWDRYFGMTAGNAIPNRLDLTSTGFVIYPQSLTQNLYPDFTESGRTYDYIAFR